jgi:hypothetical protein
LFDSWRPYSDFENQLLVTVLGCDGVENGRELLGVELDLQLAVSGRFLDAIPNGEVQTPPPWTWKIFFKATHVNNSTNNTENLAVLCRVRRCESGRQGWGEALLHGRKCAGADGRPAHGSAERLLDPTIETGVSPSQFIVNWTQWAFGLPLQHCEICGRRIGEWREGGLLREELLTA